MEGNLAREHTDRSGSSGPGRPGGAPEGPATGRVVDSFRFLDGITERLIKSWIRLESPREIPWTGQPGQSDRQREVLLVALEALARLEAPGCVANLPFEWRGSERQARAQPAVPPPIATHLKRHPWLLPRLFARNLPRDC